MSSDLWYYCLTLAFLLLSRVIVVMAEGADEVCLLTVGGYGVDAYLNTTEAIRLSKAGNNGTWENEEEGGVGGALRCPGSEAGNRYPYRVRVRNKS